MPLLNDRSSKEIEVAYKWTKVREYIFNITNNKPSIEDALFLIGVNEFGKIYDFEKEEKTYLIHVGMSKIFEGEYFKFSHRDEDGWPHYDKIKPFEDQLLSSQDALIKKMIIQYFEEHIFK